MIISGVILLRMRNWGTLGDPVAQSVEALRYKSEGRGFDSRCCHWIFSLTQSFRPYYGQGIDSASSRNEYQEYFLGVKAARCVGLTTSPPSNCRLSGNLGASNSWNPLGLTGPVQGLFLQTQALRLLASEFGAAHSLTGGALVMSFVTEC
jgi:hypothetical protein